MDAKQEKAGRLEYSVSIQKKLYLIWNTMHRGTMPKHRSTCTEVIMNYLAHLLGRARQCGLQKTLSPDRMPHITFFVCVKFCCVASGLLSVIVTALNI